jgi:hypothetical protein
MGMISSSLSFTFLCKVTVNINNYMNKYVKTIRSVLFPSVLSEVY